MKKPTPQEVTEYALSIGFKLDGQQFCDYYESKGWLVGKTPMKVWKAAVRVWRANSARFGSPQQSYAVPDLSKIEEAKRKSEELMDREWDRREMERRARERRQLKIEQSQQMWDN